MKKLFQFIFRFDKDPRLHLPWHWRNPDGSWDINLTLLLLPAIIWLIRLDVPFLLIALIFISGCSLQLGKRY